MSDDIWVLGATGRTGYAVAKELTAHGITPVLVARDREKLESASRALGSRSEIAASPAEMAAAIRREGPAVVVATVGPFQQTADELADAALASGDYLDLANDIATIAEHRRRDGAAKHAGHTVVTGAGFGVTATESILTRLMAGGPPAAKVRVDMIPSFASTPGRLGQALAGSLLDGIPGAPGGGRYQARRVVDGQLSPATLGESPNALVTPDGDEVTTGLMPLGELLAAHRASGATFVESASSEAPAGSARTLIKVALPLMHFGPLRRFATRRLAALKTPGRAAPRQHSWAHASVEWSDGTTREGWLQLGDASDVTAAVAAEVATRLAAGRGRPGAYTPAELFGAELVESCGGVYLLEDDTL